MRSTTLLIELLPAALIALLFVPGVRTAPREVGPILAPVQDADQPSGAPQDEQQQQQAGPDLVAGLRNTPGCLGVETGQMASGKQSIFAWFESKNAVRRWYYSDTHEQAMTMFTPDFEGGDPLAHVADDEGPILVIATLTMSDKPHFDGLHLPVSQISIELFKPLPGGAYLGGRLSPATFNVPHMRDLTPPADGE